MTNYRVLSFDRNTMSAVIQFEGGVPYNYSLPIVDGKLPEGDAWKLWVFLQDPNRLEFDISSVTDTSFIESLVNPTPFPTE
jgi:hypothetical protein